MIDHLYKSLRDKQTEKRREARQLKKEIEANDREIQVLQNKQKAFKSELFRTIQELEFADLLIESIAETIELKGEE